MTTVPTLYLQERPAGGEPSVWIRGTIDRRWALGLFSDLVHADAGTEQRFGPHTGHRLVLLAETTPPEAGSLSPARRRTAELAGDVELGAAALEAEVLTGRGDQADLRARKRAAAAQLRAYAAQLRSATGEASTLEAQMMAQAGKLSGILIDGGARSADERRALRALVAQGHMVHVTDQGSVRFWALASYAGAPQCGRCGRPFDPDDKDSAGAAQYGESGFCRGCIDRCHESADAFHECAVCR